jgi:EmrB/QacA subfamily drug resistance transporter
LPAGKQSTVKGVVTEQNIKRADSAVDAGTAQPRRFLVFAIVSIALMMASVDQTIVATALPTLQRDLHTQVNWSTWTITIYALGQILMMPLAGKLGDQFGRKRVFLIAVVVFTAASLCCGLAGNIYLLIGLRLVQALGGGAFMPSATGIVAQMFGPERDRALGLFSSIFPIGGIIGPVLGGVFVTYWTWRGIFLVNVPAGVLLLVLGAIFIPASVRRPDQSLDIRGVLLLGATLLSAMLGLAYLGSAQSGTGAIVSRTSPLSWEFIGPEVVAAVALVAFVRHSARAQAPFIPLRFLSGKGFGVMNLLNFLFGSAALGFAALVPLYAQNRYGLRSLEAGTLLTARAVGMIAIAGLAVFMLRRTGYRLPMVAGFSLTAVGLIGLAIAPHGLSVYAWLAVAAAICGIGMGVCTPAANNATMQLAPEHAAAVAGLRGMFRQSGAITAVSVTAAVVARSSDPGIAQAHVFEVFAAILVLSLALIPLVPEHRGNW